MLLPRYELVFGLLETIGKMLSYQLGSDNSHTSYKLLSYDSKNQDCEAHYLSLCAISRNMISKKSPKGLRFDFMRKSCRLIPTIKRNANFAQFEISHPILSNLIGQYSKIQISLE